MYLIPKILKLTAVIPKASSMGRPPVPKGWAPSVGEDVLVLSMGGAVGKVTASSGAKGRVTVKACAFFLSCSACASSHALI